MGFEPTTLCTCTCTCRFKCTCTCVHNNYHVHVHVNHNDILYYTCIIFKLTKPGRVLVGEGVLTKMCRKKAKPRQVSK